MQIAPRNHISDVENDINHIPSNFWKFINDKNNNNIYLHKKIILQICLTRGYRIYCYELSLFSLSECTLFFYMLIFDVLF